VRNRTFLNSILILLLISCQQNNSSNNNHDGTEVPTKEAFTINDLVELSKSRYGFVNADGTINEYYGDFDCTSKDNYFFDFNVGCGSLGDIVTVFALTNKEKQNTFDLYIDKGNVYYGNILTSEKKIGELTILSNNKIKGSIKLCLDEDKGCCGEVGEIFELEKIK